MTFESVSAIVEYVYKGEVLIESDHFMKVANAAHTLGVHGLKDFLPNPSCNPAKKKKEDEIVRAADSSTTENNAADQQQQEQPEQEQQPVNNQAPKPVEHSPNPPAETSDRGQPEATPEGKANKCKLRVINQPGIITNSTPNIQSGYDQRFMMQDHQVVIPPNNSSVANANNQYDNSSYNQPLLCDDNSQEVMIIDEDDDGIAICDQNFYPATNDGFSYDSSLLQPAANSGGTNSAAGGTSGLPPWMPAPPPLSQQAPMYNEVVDGNQQWQSSHHRPNNHRMMKKKEEDLDYFVGQATNEIEEIGWMNNTTSNPANDDPSRPPEVQCELEEFNSLNACATPAGWSWTIPADNSLPTDSWNMATHSAGSSAINTPSKSPIISSESSKPTGSMASVTTSNSQEVCVQSWHMLAEAAAVLSNNTAADTAAESPPLEVVTNNTPIQNPGDGDQQQQAAPPAEQQQGGLPLLAEVAQVASGNETLKSPKRSRGEGLEVRKDLQIGEPLNANDNINVASSSNEESNQLQAELIVHPCKNCDMTFGSLNQLKQHIRHAHRRIEIFACPICQLSGLVGKENLKIHMYKSHGIGEIYRCEVCNFETSSKVVFTKHEASAHLEDEPSNSTDSVSPKKLPSFNCSICSKSFKSQIGLKQHLQQHNDMGLHKVSFFDKKLSSFLTSFFNVSVFGL